MTTHIPVYRMGKVYESLDVKDVVDPRTEEVLAQVSVANAGLIRRDLQRLAEARATLAKHSVAELMEICARAGEIFLNDDLPWGAGDNMQSPEDYVSTLSRTSGLPVHLCRTNMEKIYYVLTNMPIVLGGLTRGLDLAVMDHGILDHGGLAVSFFPTTNALGVVLPSNSPAVNSLWLPALAMKTPVILKPGSEEPWTPWRLVQALVKAGMPGEALGFYPTSHEGANDIMDGCGRAIIFGDQNTVNRYRARPEISVHGPGWSKILIGEDRIDDWESMLDVLHDSAMLNSGRSCINASTLMVPRHGKAIAEALAKRMLDTQPKPLNDPEARLSAFANPAFAQWIDAAVTEGLEEDGAEDVTARLRGDTPRLQELDGSTFLQPTLVYCENLEHPLAVTEYMFPFISVVEVPQEQMLAEIGPSLVITAITEDTQWLNQLLASPHIDRLNVGAIPTPKVQWNQPHEGNLFEFLYRRRSIQTEDNRFVAVAS